MEEKLSIKRRIIVFVGNEEEALANSNLLANIAAAISKQKKRVIVLDAHRGKIDASIPLGITVRLTLEDALRSSRQASEAMYTGALNVKFVKIGDISSYLNRLDFEAKKKFINQWACFEEESDIILISEPVPLFALASQEMAFFTSPSSKTVTSTYGRVKQVLENSKDARLYLVVNMCNTEKEAKGLSKRFISTVKRFLNAEIEDLGYVLLEPEVVKSLKSKALFIVKYPYSAASGSVYSMAHKMLNKKVTFKAQELKAFWR
jgi:flagellar biosynthesis protein FlhG